MPSGSLPTGKALESFLERVAKADRRALLLDFDGTLAPFRADRDAVEPHPGVREHLNGILAAGHTRLVLVSGRSVENLRGILGLGKTPEIWGSHGWERLSAEGRYERSPLPPAAPPVLDEAAAWAEVQGWHQRVERKPASVALHWRGLDPRLAGAIHGKAQRAWSVLARKGGLKVHAFDGGIELRVPGVHKGVAVETLLRELGPGAAVAYLGDDDTDEDAFQVLRGRGLGVLVRDLHRPTAAEAWIETPRGTLEFLVKWRRACGETGL